MGQGEAGAAAGRPPGSRLHPHRRRAAGAQQVRGAWAGLRVGLGGLDLLQLAMPARGQQRQGAGSCCVVPHGAPLALLLAPHAHR